MALISDLQTLFQQLNDAAIAEADKTEIDSQGNIISQGDDISDQLTEDFIDGYLNTIQNSIESGTPLLVPWSFLGTFPPTGSAPSPGMVTGILVIDASRGKETAKDEMLTAFSQALAGSLTDVELAQTFTDAVLILINEAKLTTSITGTATDTGTGSPIPVTGTATTSFSYSGTDLVLHTSILNDFIKSSGTQQSSALALGTAILTFLNTVIVDSEADSPYNGLIAPSTTLSVLS